MKLGVRELVVFVLLLGFLVGSYQLGFRRLQAERAYYRDDVERKRQTLITLAASTASVDELEQDLTGLRGDVERFEKRLPTQKDVAQVLGDVWKLGERHGMRSPSVRPLKSERSGACWELPIEVGFDGEFPGFYGFLQELESSDRIVRVTQLDLSKINDPNKPMQAKLTLNIYFEPDDAGRGTGTTSSTSTPNG